MNRPSLFGIPVVIDPELLPGTFAILRPDQAQAYHAEKHAKRLRLIEALTACGFDIEIAGSKPLATLPAEFADALREVTSDRANRDPAENFYRDAMGRLSDGFDTVAYPIPEDEDDQE